MQIIDGNLIRKEGLNMAKNSNASPEVFGFDFQVNATIFLMLDNIKEVKEVRMEGASEDIELTMNNGSQIMAQAKGIVKGSSDFSKIDCQVKCNTIKEKNFEAPRRESEN